MVDSVRERIVSVLLTRTSAARAYTRPDALPARGLFIGPDTDGQTPVYGGQQLTLTATLEQVESVPTPGADIAAFAAAVDARATAALAELIAALGSGEIDDGTFLADPPTITSATAGLAEGNPTLLAARVEFSVTYRHARGDPYTPA